MTINLSTNRFMDQSQVYTCQVTFIFFFSCLTREMCALDKFGYMLELERKAIIWQETQGQCFLPVSQLPPQTP